MDQLKVPTSVVDYIKGLADLFEKVERIAERLEEAVEQIFAAMDEDSENEEN